MKKYHTKFYNQIDSKKVGKIITECYKGNKYEDIAKKYNIPVWLVSHLKRRWERENLYGQHTGKRINIPDNPNGAG